MLEPQLETSIEKRGRVLENPQLDKEENKEKVCNYDIISRSIRQKRLKFLPNVHGASDSQQHI